MALTPGGETWAAPDKLRLPDFPVPALVMEDGSPREMNPIRLLRELQSSGFRGYKRLETMDYDYAVLRSDALDELSAWLEAACQAVGFDLINAPRDNYDGTVFVRLLSVSTSLASLRERGNALAIPIGVLVCRRAKPWGNVPGDGIDEAYVIFATEDGMLVYDPPTRQLIRLGDFPNRDDIVQIRF